MSRHRKFTTICLAAVLALGLAACGGGGDDTATVDPTPPVVEPTPYEMAVTNIAAATTATDAQKAVDDAAANVSGAQLIALQAAADARKDALAMMDRADAQKMALTAAAGMVDTSDLSDQAMVDAAKAAIAELEAALAAASDVSDADKAMYQGQVTAAEAMVAAAQSALDHAAQTMALSGAVEALQALDLSDLSTQAAIDAAEAAIAALRTALAAATELSDAEKTAAMTELATASRTVMAAQGSVDIEGQTMVLADAVAALAAIDFNALMTQEDIDAANAAVITLDLALAAATDLTDAQKLDATVDVTVAKRKVTAAETVLADNIDAQRMALTEADTALAGIDLDDLSDQAKIDAADAAVDALQAALDGATHLSDADKAMYQSQLDDADETVKMAQTGMDEGERMTAQRTAIMTAATMASTAVAGVSDTSTESEVAAADAAVQAVKDAIAEADDLSEGDAEIIKAQAVLGVIEPQLAAKKTSRIAAMEKADEETGMANAALGRAMHAALGTNVAGATTYALANAAVTWTGAGPTITPAVGAGITGADDPALAAVTFTATQASSAGALGSWNGMNYADTNPGTKVVNEARVYTNKGPGSTVAFKDMATGTGYDVATADSDDDFKGYITLDETDATQRGRIRGAAFAGSGTQNYTYAAADGAYTTRGTYDGAAGQYRCTGACSVTNDGKGGPDALGGAWHFKPDAGANAMALQPDTSYLYYGWWVNKNKDGMLTAASAFFGTVSPPAALTTDPATITGSATYNGHAAGKFALNDLIAGTGDGGHFTADATLTATFGGGTPTNPGITGTIDNFMANDKSVPWSVALHLAPWGTGGAFASTSDRTNTDADGTTWSIDGNSAPESGHWNGQMYDEATSADDTMKDDGSNLPTTVTGRFYSEFASSGRMVGAFGADKQ